MTWLLVTTRPSASMTKPEPSELTRRGLAGALVLALAAAVLEELLEELLERRAGRKLRSRPRFRALARSLPRRRPAGRDGLRGGDVDHRVDHGFGHVGDIVGAARLRLRGERERDHRRCDDRERGAAEVGEEGAGHGRQSSKRGSEICGDSAPGPVRAQGRRGRIVRVLGGAGLGRKGGLSPRRPGRGLFQARLAHPSRKRSISSGVW